MNHVPLHQRDSYLRGALAGFGMANALVAIVLCWVFIFAGSPWFIPCVPVAYMGLSVYRRYTPWR